MRSRKNEPEAPAESLSLPGGPPCMRCGGDRQGDHVSGGWLLHFKLAMGLWYTSVRCCPDCGYGHYRQRCTGQAFYRQFPDATIHELSVLWAVLRPGMSLSQAADVVPYAPLRMRLLEQARQIEEAERMPASVGF